MEIKKLINIDEKRPLLTEEYWNVSESDKTRLDDAWVRGQKLRGILEFLAGILIYVTSILVCYCLMAIGYGKCSPYIWHEVTTSYRNEGLFFAFFAAYKMLSTYFVSFYFLGHEYSKKIYRRSGEKPIYPYVINFLAGIILMREGNAFFMVASFLFGPSG